MKCLDSNNNETDKKAMCSNSFLKIKIHLNLTHHVMKQIN